MDLIKKHVFWVGELVILLACLTWCSVSGYTLPSTLLNSVVTTVLVELIVKLTNRKK